ncbi:MAG: hypothetical protein ACQGVC_18485 [Myxococcota bacterium]
MAERPGKETRELRSLADESDASDEGRPDTGSSSLGGIPELMRKAFTAGFSGFFLTEEAIRKALGDTLPKDWTDFAVDQSDRARAEFLERLSYEIGRAMENVDYAAVLSQLLEGRTLEVSATIKLSDKDQSGRQGLRFEVGRTKDER